MKAKSAPDPRRAKLHHSYTIAEAAKLFDVHRNTVRSWIKAGLETVSIGRVVLILGDELRAFLEKRKKARRASTPPGWLYCMKCRTPRAPAEGLAELIHDRGATGNVRAICGQCAALMHRRVSMARLEDSGFGDLAGGKVTCT